MGKRVEGDKFEVLWSVELQGNMGHPGKIEGMPGVIAIDGNPIPQGLEGIGESFLQDKPHIRKGAEKLGKDLAVYVSGHGRGILIGAGIATLAGFGVVVLYKHRHKEVAQQPQTINFLTSRISVSNLVNPVLSKIKNVIQSRG